MPTTDVGTKIEYVAKEIAAVNEALSELIKAVHGSRDSLSNRLTGVEISIDAIKAMLDDVKESNRQQAAEQAQIKRDMLVMDTRLTSLDKRVAALEADSDYIKNLGWKAVLGMVSSAFVVGSIIAGTVSFFVARHSL